MRFYGTCSCLLPTLITLVIGGGGSNLPACSPLTSFSVHLAAVPLLRQGLSINPGVTTWCDVGAVEEMMCVRVGGVTTVA